MQICKSCEERREKMEAAIKRSYAKIKARIAQLRGDPQPETGEIEDANRNIESAAVTERDTVATVEPSDDTVHSGESAVTTSTAGSDAGAGESAAGTIADTSSANSGASGSSSSN